MMPDKKFHDAYKADAYFVPATNVICRNCGTRLKVYYAEEQLYAVKCGFCETITLVKANNPTEAMRYVGEYAENLPVKKKIRKYYRKCGVCGERHEQSEMIRTNNSPNGWICFDCHNAEYPEYEDFGEV